MFRALGSIPDDIFNAARIDETHGASSSHPSPAAAGSPHRDAAQNHLVAAHVRPGRHHDGRWARSTQTINHYIYQVAFGRSLDMGYSSALAYILVIGLSIFAFFYVKFLNIRPAWEAMMSVAQVRTAARPKRPFASETF